MSDPAMIGGRSVQGAPAMPVAIMNTAMPNDTALSALSRNSGAADANTLRTEQAKRSLTQVCSTASAAGDTAVVAAPGAGYRLVVTSFVIQNESAAATTMLLKSGSVVCWRCLGQNQGDGLSKDFAVGHSWRLAENAALNLNLSGANQCGYSVSYFVEAV